MDTLDFFVKVMPKEQSGGGGGSVSPVDIKPVDSLVDAASNMASTSDFALISIIAAFILIFAAAFAFAYCKKKQVVTSHASHAKSMNSSFKSKFSTRCTLSIALIAVFTFCVACILAFGGFRNAIADDDKHAPDGFWTVDEEYVYEPEDGGWNCYVAGLVNEDADASITGFHVDKLVEIGDSNYTWDVCQFLDSEEEDDIVWYEGPIDGSLDVSGLEVDFPLTDLKEDWEGCLMAYVDSDDLTDEDFDSAVGKDIFKVSLTIESLSIYKKQNINNLDLFSQAAIEQINDLSGLSDDEKEQYNKKITDEQENGNNTISQASTYADVDAALQTSQTNIQKIVDDAKAKELENVKKAANKTLDDKKASADDEIEKIEYLTDTQKAEYKQKITDTTQKGKTAVSKATSVEDVKSIVETTSNEIDDIVKDANETAIKPQKEIVKQALQNLVDSTKDNISGMSGLYESDITRISSNLDALLTEATQKIDDATTVDQIVEAAIDFTNNHDQLVADAEELSNIKATRRSQIRSVYDATKQAITGSEDIQPVEKSTLIESLKTDVYDKSMAALESSDSPEAVDNASKIMLYGAQQMVVEIIQKYPNFFNDFKNCSIQVIEDNLNNCKESVDNFSNLNSEQKQMALETLEETAKATANQITELELENLHNLVHLMMYCEAQQFVTVAGYAKNDISAKQQSSIDKIKKLGPDGDKSLSEQNIQAAIDAIDSLAEEQCKCVDKLIENSGSSPVTSLNDCVSDFNSSSSANVADTETFSASKQTTISRIKNKAQEDNDIVNASTLTDAEKKAASDAINTALDQAMKDVEDAQYTFELSDVVDSMNSKCDEVIEGNDISDDAKVYSISNLNTLAQEALLALDNFSVLDDESNDEYKSKEEYKAKIEQVFNDAMSSFEEAQLASEFTIILDNARSSMMATIKSAAKESLDSVDQNAKSNIASLTSLSEKDQNRYELQISRANQAAAAIISAITNFSDVASYSNQFISTTNNILIDAEKINDTKATSYSQIDSHYNYAIEAFAAAGWSDDQIESAKKALSIQKSDYESAIFDSVSVSESYQQAKAFDCAMDSFINNGSDAAKAALQAFIKSINSEIDTVKDVVTTKSQEFYNNHYIDRTTFDELIETIAFEQTIYDNQITNATKASEVTIAQGNFVNALYDVIIQACDTAIPTLKSNYLSIIESLELSDSVKEAYKSQIETYVSSASDAIEKSYTIDRAIDNFDNLETMLDSLANEAQELSSAIQAAKSAIVTLQTNANTEIAALQNLTAERIAYYQGRVNTVAQNADNSLANAQSVDQVNVISGEASQSIQAIVTAAKAEAATYTITFSSNDTDWGTVSTDKISGLEGETYIEENTDNSLTLKNGDAAYEVKVSVATGCSFNRWTGIPDDKIVKQSTNIQAIFSGPTPTACNVTCSIDSQEHGTVTLSDKFPPIEPNTSYSVKGDVITFGNTSDAPTITYASNGTGYKLDKWQYKTDSMDDYSDLPEDATYWVINANTDFKAITVTDKQQQEIIFDQSDQSSVAGQTSTIYLNEAKNYHGDLTYTFSYSVAADDAEDLDNQDFSDSPMLDYFSNACYDSDTDDTPYFTFDKDNLSVTCDSTTPKSNYTLSVAVNASGDDQYLPGSKTSTFKWDVFKNEPAGHGYDELTFTVGTPVKVVSPGKLITFTPAGKTDKEAIDSATKTFTPSDFIGTKTLTTRYKPGGKVTSKDNLSITTETTGDLILCVVSASEGVERRLTINGQDYSVSDPTTITVSDLAAGDYQVFMNDGGINIYGIYLEYGK